MNKNQKIGLIVIAIVGASFGGWLVYNQISVAVGANSTPFIDSKGREVWVPRHPNRIVSVAPSITETLFAINANDRLVGVTDYCNYPVAAKNITSIGGFTTPNLEVLTSLNPDLIIVADDHPDNLKVLENTGIPVVVILAHTIEEIIQNIRKIGILVDCQAAAGALADNMTARVSAVLAKTQSISTDQKLTCYFEVWETPKVAGAGSFINNLITIAGGTNIFGDINDEWPTVTNEMVISKNPDVIFVTAMGRAFYSTDISNRTGYGAINAIKNSRVYTCDDDVFTRPGPRIVEALEIMTNCLYPSLVL